jgi:DNA-directed RNA polymerase specialized sigma24 family protein
MSIESYIMAITGRLPEDIRDDVRQEIRIAIWKAGDRADNPESFAKSVARKTVSRFDRSRVWTGQAPRPVGSGRKYLSETKFYTTQDFAFEDQGDVEFEIDFERMVAGLSEKDKIIVRRRIFNGDTWAEIGREIGMSLQGTFNRWDRTILPELRKHYEDSV